MTVFKQLGWILKQLGWILSAIALLLGVGLIGAFFDLGAVSSFAPELIQSKGDELLFIGIGILGGIAVFIGNAL